MKRFLFLLTLAWAATATVSAQEMKRDSTAALSLEVEALTFFKDNEFEGEQAKGYSLPGLWLQPRLVYQPLDAIRLEAGFHAAIFDGANKYPCYAYHDIGRWKGNQYQRGAHVLPFFRAQAQLGRVTFVLGDIYGAERHGVTEPLWNPELTLTQDPEMGFQLLAQLPRWSLDAWINWQSYIFEEDTHQEAFTVGLRQRILLNSPQARLHWYVPIDILVQHRGGEQDVTDMGVQTLTNGATGIALQWNAGTRVLQRLTAEVTVLGCWQQSGELWPFKAGVAGYAACTADFAKGFRAFCSLLGTQKFAALYGVPFYSTLSQKHEGGRFAHMIAPHVGMEWRHTFGSDYTLGAKVDAYPLAPGTLTYADGHTDKASFSTNFSFGVFFRCRPSFVLMKRRVNR